MCLWLVSYRRWRLATDKERYLRKHRHDHEPKLVVTEYFVLCNDQRPYRDLGYRTPSSVHNPCGTHEPVAEQTADYDLRKTSALRLKVSPVLH